MLAFLHFCSLRQVAICHFLNTTQVRRSKAVLHYQLSALLDITNICCPGGDLNTSVASDAHRREWLQAIACLIETSGEEQTAVVKRVLRFIIIGLLASCTLEIGSLGNAEGSEKVLVLQSVMIPPYEAVVQGFRSVCCNEPIERLAVHEQEPSDLLKHVRNSRPSLILAIGLEALRKAQDVKEIPVVYCMVLTSPSHPLGNGINITGVSMNVPQEKQLGMFIDALPEVKRIGIVYSAGHTGRFAESACMAAKGKNITVVRKEVESSKEVAPAMEAMKGSIDAFWMLPDMTLINEVTVEYMLSFSMENHIPLLTFSNMYVEQGALMSIGVDTEDIGAQAGEMAKKILSGSAVKNVPPVEARKAVSHINLTVAKKLGVTLEKDVVNRSVIVH